MRFGFAVIAGALFLSGCATTGLGWSSGPFPGATPGQPAVKATVVAAMGAGLVGTGLGTRLARSERRLALEAEYKALEYTPAGQEVKWQGDSPDRSGEVVAAQPYRVGSQDCRQYTHTLSIDGQKQMSRGTACRNADGSWTPLT